MSDTMSIGKKSAPHSNGASRKSDSCNLKSSVKKMSCKQDNFAINQSKGNKGIRTTGGK